MFLSMEIEHLSDDAVVAKIIRTEQVKEVHWTGHGSNDKEAAENAIRYFIADGENDLNYDQLEFVWGKVTALKLKPEDERLFWIMVYYTDESITDSERRLRIGEQRERLQEDIHNEIFSA